MNAPFTFDRKLSFPALLNARDLGGCPTADGRRTRYGSLVRADSPSRLTPEGIQSVLDYGVRTIVDLRFPNELATHPNPFASLDGATSYHHCSLLGESWESWVTRGPAPDSDHWYAAFFDYSQPEMLRIMQTIAGAPDGGCLFHCAAGKDRTGVVAMLLLALANVRADVIVADYAVSAIYLQASFEEYLSGFTDPVARAKVIEDQRCEPAFAANTLSHLRQRYGDAEGYLRRIGLSDDQISRLRARLL